MTDVRLIVGPPGCGKSHALANEAEQAGAEYGGHDVAICSLTRTAAAEIAARAPVPDENVGTLHSHAFHALERPALAETREGIRAWNDAHPDLKLSGANGTLDDLDAGNQIDDERTDIDAVHQGVSNHRARMTPVELWTDMERDLFARWSDWKQQTGRLDFTDLIEKAIREIPAHPAAPRTLLGDEAQDFSTLELALFRQWASHADRAVLCADPLQVIYSWRGADPHAFDRIDAEHTTYLRQSYRLSTQVHAAAVGWASMHGLTVPDYRPRPDTDHHEVGQTPWSLRWCEPIVDDIADRVAADQTVMLLTTCGYMLTPALAALKAAGLPFHNQLRPDRGAWNPLRGARRLAAFLRPSPAVWGDDAQPWTWADLQAWTEPLAARGTFARGAKSLIESKCEPDRFGNSQSDEAVPLSLLASLLDADDDHPALRLDVDWWESRLLASAKDRMRYPLAVYRARGGRALLDPPKVTVGTIHSVKGGEADHVILCPDLSRVAMYHGWHGGGEPRDHIVRTFYVALTRARETITVLSPSCGEHVHPGQLANLQAAAA